MLLFAVIRTMEVAWQPSAPLGLQADWEAYALYMDGLQQEGFVSLAVHQQNPMSG
jgi:hypothetical protein